METQIEVPLRLDGEIHRIAATVRPPVPLDGQRRSRLTARIRELLEQQDAVIIAHYYVDGELQTLAEATGGYVSDSLDMASFGSRHEAHTLVVVGVRFMGETAKILNPEKRILMPDLDANCSLDMGCPAAQFSAFCDQHPDRSVVVYANTSAAVKARSDWVVTSSNALDIVSHLRDRGEKILWGPDRHLGHYIQQQTGADMLMWQGSCVVHDEFKAAELKRLIAENPGAEVLVHPESPEDVVALAHVVGSTTRIIKAAQESGAHTLIIATDRGLFHKLHEVAPDKKLLISPTGGHGATCTSCAHCPWMAMNGLENLAAVLESGNNEVRIDEAIRSRALLPIQRMLEFSRNRGLISDGDA